MRVSQQDVIHNTSTQSLRPALEREESCAALAPKDGFSSVLAQGGYDAAAHARDLNRITRDTPSRASHSLLQMQRTHGNRYVQRVLEIARQGEGEGEVSPEVEASIERSRGGGQSLEKGTRSQMESAFGADFSGVRIHTGAESHSLNRAVSAVAFTTGSDIFFRDGAYDPGSSGGRELLAHELTHVVQQGGSRSVQGKLVVGKPDDQHEGEANSVAKTVVRALEGSSDSAGQALESGGPTIQRQCACGGSPTKDGMCEKCKAKHASDLQGYGAGPTLSRGLQRIIRRNEEIGFRLMAGDLAFPKRPSRNIQRVAGADDAAEIAALMWCVQGALVTVGIDEAIQVGESLWKGEKFRQNWCKTLFSALFGCVFGVAGGAFSKAIFTEGGALAGPGVVKWLIKKALTAGYTQLAGKLGLILAKAGCDEQSSTAATSRTESGQGQTQPAVEAGSPHSEEQRVA